MQRRAWFTGAAAGVLYVATFSVPAQARGHLVLIGGGEKPREAMETFVQLAGGPDAAIVVVPTASEEADTAEYYLKLFGEDYSCTHVTVLPIHRREDAARSDLAATARMAGGVFFAGGDQLRITRALLDTPVGDAIADAFAAGAAVGGTSAGMACQSALMITGEGDFTVIRAGAVELLRGLGFFPGVIVDQHFIARQRLNRLLTVILEHPDLLGVGVDEDTAVWVRPNDTLRVLGKRSVVVVDAKGAAVSHLLGGDGHELLGIHNLRVHVVLPGEEFDLTKRAIVPPSPAVQRGGEAKTR